MNIPNLISSLRILLIPVLILAFYYPSEWRHFTLAAIFAIASISDWLDGYLARKWNQHTAFGAFIDPVADKIIVAVALILLIEEYASIIITIPAIVIIGREIIISALREWMAEIGKRTSVAVSYIGKLKTAMQMIAIIILLVGAPGTIISWVGIAVLYGAVMLTLWSMLIYLAAAWDDLTKDM